MSRRQAKACRDKQAVRRGAVGQAVLVGLVHNPGCAVDVGEPAELAAERHRLSQPIPDDLAGLVF
jgi:hypothetical protein